MMRVEPAPQHPGNPRLLTLGDFFGDEEREEVAIAPFLPLRALDQLAPRAAGIREVQALE